MPNNRKTKQKLRLGLLMDSFSLPAWAYTMLERIVRSDFAEINLIVLNSVPAVRQSGLFKFENWNKLIYLGYQKFENKTVKLKPNAFVNRDSKSLLSGVPTVQVTPENTRIRQSFTKEDIRKIKKYQIDVFVKLGFRNLAGEILKVARFGVWEFSHGNNRVDENGPAGFWEVLEEHPVTASRLEILSENGQTNPIIYSSNICTNIYAVKRNRNTFYWKSLSFLPRKLQELYEFGGEKFFEKNRLRHQESNSNLNQPYKFPYNKFLLSPLTKYLFRSAIRKIEKKAFIKQWILLFDLRDGIPTSFAGFKKIIPPKNRLWADPFIVYRDEKYFIFIEESFLRPKKGFISVIVMDADGHYDRPKKIIEKSYHLSYPFIFEWQGEYFMIPESSANRTIEVYRCTKFPYKWEFHQNLMEDIDAVDSTLIYDDQKWWLFASIRENAGYPNWDELFLFYADHPLSKSWTPHPQNPVISDVRKARPAGKIFRRENKIYRPSQNSSKRYGYGLKINQIVKLNETEYEETEVRSFEPNWDNNLQAVHSFNFENKLTVIDALFKRPKYF